MFPAGLSPESKITERSPSPSRNWASFSAVQPPGAAAILSFLRFAEHNLEIFKKRELHIFTDFPILMYLINNGIPETEETSAVLREAKRTIKQITYKVKWIEAHMNRAASPISNIPNLPADAKIKIKTFANFAAQKPSTEHPGDAKL
jgi:hypothetical protein